MKALSGNSGSVLLSTARCFLAIILSVLALLATFYQLYLQRIHNEKSLQPLGQIDLRDRNNQVSVCVTNNGMGPMIIDRLTFFKDGNSYPTIGDCLSLAPGAYSNILINESVKKVVLPNCRLEVFAAELEPHEGSAEIRDVRKQLTPITLRVNCRDIYGNKFILERSLEWFFRHMTDENSVSYSN